MKSKMASKGG